MPTFVFTPKYWRLYYGAFNESAPFQGQRCHQLCIGPFIWEWTSRV